MATLTYVYADSTAVLGPLATFAEPHCYDLCAKHSARLTVPLGWEVIQLTSAGKTPPPGPDDLLALADAVREAANAGDMEGANPDDGGTPPMRARRSSLEPPAPGSGSAPGRRGHLHILPD